MCKYYRTGDSPAATDLTLVSVVFVLKFSIFNICSPQLFWSIGSVFTVGVAMAVMPTLGWRWLLGFLSLPLLCFISMSYVSILHYELTMTNTALWGAIFGILLCSGSH